ncbi:MAG: adenylate/guanylate cyclase domain-containing protein [Actinomycetota bacterium]
MADFRLKNLRDPDETVEFPLVKVDAVDVGETTIAHSVSQPGWRWSTHVRPSVGGDWCQARHMGVAVSGRLAVVFDDGTETVIEPNDVFDLPPGHDAYVIGDEPYVSIEWSGHRAFVRDANAAKERVLTTLLFVDVVGSTELLARIGDGAWRERIAEAFQDARGALERFGGREVDAAGDGMFAVFDGPARALRCAVAIRRAAERSGLKMRAGVHVGEVEVVGDRLRGLAVHQAARVMEAASAGEILVSETTRALAIASGLSFDARGAYRLKGLEGEHQLYGLTDPGLASS